MSGSKSCLPRSVLVSNSMPTMAALSVWKLMSSE